MFLTVVKYSGVGEVLTTLFKNGGKYSGEPNLSITYKRSFINFESAKSDGLGYTCKQELKGKSIYLINFTKFI